MNALTATFHTFPNNTTTINTYDAEGVNLHNITLGDGYALVGVKGVRTRALLDATNLDAATRWVDGAWVLVMGAHTLPLPGGVLARLREAFGLTEG